MIRNLLKLIEINIMRKHNKTWFGRLLDKEDHSTAMSNFIIFVILFLASLLLLLPVYAIGVEIWFNHLNSNDMSGWATYIGAVTTLIMSACGLKWGINYTDRKFPMKDPFDNPHNHFGNEEQQINESLDI